MDLRNAPTPPLIKDEDFGLDTISFQNYQTSYGANEINIDFDNTQTITFPQSYEYNQPYTNGLAQEQQYSTISYLPNTFIEHHSGRDSVVSKTSRKDKCMTRNAIAARENREKKKHEIGSLRNRLTSAEQEAATYKKKYNDLKEAYKRSHEQNQYYESLLAKLPDLVNIIEHMTKVPNDEQSKKLRRKFDSMNLSNSNNNNLGICFHVKASHAMSLKFCESCSNGQTSVAKKKLET